MKRLKNMSIRKKILFSMLTFTIIPIVMVTVVALNISYQMMREQLIYNHRMSTGWLQDRLALEVGNMSDKFYDFEVDKTIKADITQWCTSEDPLGHEASWGIISLMNAITNMNNSINSVELYNFAQDDVLVAARSGADIREIGGELTYWDSRDIDAQNDVVYIRRENEISVVHQMHRFKDGMPLALISINLRPSALQDILENIKTIPEETIFLFNDQNELILADYGENWAGEMSEVENIVHIMSTQQMTETFLADEFCFYRSVAGGKLQILKTIPNSTIVDALTPMLLSGMGVAIIAVIASSICAVFFTKTISKPIRVLSDKVKTMTLDEVNEIFAEDRQDEIGLLQTSFDYMVRRNQELITQQYYTELQKRDAQLRALQAQINPHFMYNTLQVIGGMSLQKNAPEVYEITVALSEIMRYSLSFQREMVPLKEEIRYLQSYIKIQNERFGKKIDLRCNLLPETLSYYIPKLILQPLVENSFQHGLADKPGKWIISLDSAFSDAGDLLIRIKDNGIGMDKARLAEIVDQLQYDADNMLRLNSHIGLSNVHARIRLRCAGEQYGLLIQSTPEDGTSICVCIKAFPAAEEELYV